MDQRLLDLASALQQVHIAAGELLKRIGMLSNEYERDRFDYLELGDDYELARFDTRVHESTAEMYAEPLQGVRSAMVSLHQAVDRYKSVDSDELRKRCLDYDPLALWPTDQAETFVRYVAREWRQNRMSIEQWQKGYKKLSNICDSLESTMGKVEAIPELRDHLEAEGLDWLLNHAATSPSKSDNGAEREAADDGPDDGVVDQSPSDGKAERKPSASANGAAMPPCVDIEKLQLARQFIADNGGATQRTVARHAGVESVTFRRWYVPALRSYGVVSGPNGRGLFIDETAKTKHAQQCSAT